MTPEEEDALLHRVATLSQKVDDLQAEIDGYRVNGLADAFNGTGNQRFGGGKMRLDQGGIQIIPTTGYPILWTLNFTSTPLSPPFPAVTQSAVLTSGSTSQMILRASYDANNSAASILQGLSTRSVASMQVSWGGNSSNVDLYQSSTDAYVAIPNGFQLNVSQEAADPTVTLYDSSIWYRTDTDRFRVRADGIVRNMTTDGTNTTLTIATGAVTATTSFHAIDTEAAAATDDLDTISGGQTGQVLYIHAANGARDVVAKDGTGNLQLAGDFTMNNVEDTLTLIYDGSNWLELCRSDNGA